MTSCGEVSHLLQLMQICHNLEKILKLKQQSFMNDLRPHVQPCFEKDFLGIELYFFLHQTEYFSFQGHFFYLAIVLKFHYTGFLMQSKSILFIQCLVSLSALTCQSIALVIFAQSGKSYYMLLQCQFDCAIKPLSQWFSILCPGLLKKHEKEETKSYRHSFENTYWTYFTFLYWRLTVTAYLLCWQGRYLKLTPSGVNATSHHSDRFNYW